MQKKRFSIIPDAEQKSILNTLSFEGKSERYKEIFWFTSSLVVVGIVYLIFFLVGQHINNKINNLTQEQAKLEVVATNDDKRKELELFVQRVNAIQTIIAETKYPSEFFPVLTNQLSRFVTLTNLSLDVDGATVFVTAEADSPETVESQFEFWRQHTEFIESVQKNQLPSSDEDADDVVFSAVLQINPAFLQLRSLSVPADDDTEEST